MKNQKKKNLKKKKVKKEDEEENVVEDKQFGDEFEIVKTEVDKEIGITNMARDDVKFSEAKTWEKLGIKETIQKGLLEMGFLQPSPIQSTTFPIIMKEPRLNVIAQAKNGSGKTAAFGLGVISSIDENNNDIQAVVFGHTRELVIQIKDVLTKIAKYTKIKITAPLSQEETK